MRRIVAILIVAFLSFWVVYGLVAPFRDDIVNPFVLNVAGPTFYYGLGSIVNGVISSVGLAGFAAITLTIGLIGGIIAHFYWVKADWSIRRWGSRRTAQDLGATQVTPTSTLRATTPAEATVRPPLVTTAQLTAPIEEEKPKETTSS